MNQREVFLDREGDSYFERNVKKLDEKHAEVLLHPERDPVLKELVRLRPKRILEVGCANGWRLDAAYQLWGADCIGIDPSAAAVSDGIARFPHLNLAGGTADQLPCVRVDCVVFGFCLYLCDTSDLFHIAAEADRILNRHGYLVIYDFYPPAPHSNPYAHRQGLFSRKMDYSKLWSWHPSYMQFSHSLCGESPDPYDPEAVTVLRKL
jgi:SAM-dependent methyltransferase